MCNSENAADRGSTAEQSDGLYNKTKFLSILTALLVSVSLILSGCNQDGNQQQGEQSGDSSQEEQAPDNGRDPTAGVVEIRDMTVMELAHDMGQGSHV